MRALDLPAAAVEAALLRSLPETGLGRLLDIGTGTGRLLEVLAPRVTAAIGIDASRAMLALARARLSRPGLMHCSVRLADMYRLPMTEPVFDTVVLQMVLHYAEDPAGALAEAARVLRPGGRLLVVDLAEHERPDCMERFAHRWPGFPTPHMHDLFAQAGLGAGGDHLRARPAGSAPLVGHAGRPTCTCRTCPGSFRMTRPHLLDALRDQVLLCDGGMGSRVQALTLDVEKDYWGQENCTDVLNLSRPDIVRDIHRGYFAAGADMVETNSFGGSPVTLGEFDLQDRAFEINKAAGELAREAAESFSDGRHRWVVGSVGPGTKLPSLGNIAYDPLEAALAEQCRGLIAGGVDAILIETCQDTLQIKAAVNGAKIARRAAGTDTPIFVQVTVETTGTLLVGPDIAAAATVVQALDVPLMGLNCATGPQEMAEHVKWLAANWPGLLSMQPNAGLPELVDGRTHYPLGAAEMASWMERYVAEDGINLIGGCCGTSIEHIEALDAMLRKRGGFRPAPVQRTVVWMPSVASLYQQVGAAPGEQLFLHWRALQRQWLKKWRELQEQGDWDGCVAMGREQIAEGSNSLDVCTAFVGRDEIAEMDEVIRRFTSSVNSPLVIDSTETPVIASALKLHGGKPIINSINFEDGEHAAEDRMKLAKQFGAAVIALTIDEQGMAKSPERKLEIASRLVEFACDKHGLQQSDLLIDPLTFTIATGNEDDRKLGQWTLEGIRMIRDRFPDIQIILGLSNISFGLNPAARAVLNSVFLDHAVRAGMTGAIVHVSKIRPLHLIAAEEVKVCRGPDLRPAQRRLRSAAEAAGDLRRPQSWPTPSRKAAPRRSRSG